MSGEGGEKVAVTSYSLEVLLAAKLGGGRDVDKPVPARLLSPFISFVLQFLEFLFVLNSKHWMCY